MKQSAQYNESSQDNAALVAKLSERAKKLIAHEPELAQTFNTPEDSEAITKAGTHSIEFLAEAFRRYAGHACMGSRQGSGPYSTLTFAEVWTRIEQLAAAWHATGEVKPGDGVGILGFASPDWCVADFACLYTAAISVPLRTSVGDDELAYMINDSKLRYVISSAEQYEALASILDGCPSVEKVVVIDTPNVPKLANKPNVPVQSLTQMLALGTKSPAVAPTIPGRDTKDNDPLLTIVYTSGSTGRPKGAMFPESIWHHTFKTGFFDMMPRMPQIQLCFMPLNHIAGRGSLIHTIMSGGVTYFAQKSDLSTLFDDIRAARPTNLFLVPRISETIYQTFKWRCAKEGSVDDPAIQKRVMQEMRHTYLGDRLMSATIGTAPTAPEVVAFIRDCFEIPVFNGYGATENGVVTFEDHIVRSSVTDYKLVDVPELGYFTSDKPYPRGELRIKSPRVIPGYLNRPEATDALRDEDGFMKTGDIVEERGQDHVVWIDRKANVIKLSQGEFVGVSQLETEFVANSPLLKQVYMYGNSARSYLLAVVAPNPDSGISGDALRPSIRKEFDRVGQLLELQGYEIPRDFIISDTPFTKANGLLTESEKPARQKLKGTFGAALEQLYVRIEERANKSLEALRDAKGLDTIEQVRRVIIMALGLGDDNLAPDSSFVQCGGDSLSAVRAVDLLQQVCDVAVPVGMVLDQRTSVKQLASYIDAQKERGDSALTVEHAHGHATGHLKLDEIKLDTFLPDGDALAVKAKPITKTPKHVLLTGATGFLGRFLVLSLLRELQSRDGTLVCIVRADDDKAAWQRLRDEYARSGVQALNVFESLSENLEVLAGDLIRPHFGLNDERYHALCGRTDTIVHNGALVNHALSYGQLFEPNVLGTVELMRFALTDQLKRFNFMSTVAVPGGARSSGEIGENQTGRQLWKARAMEGHYAAGYGSSKWACEVLLEEFAERSHVPVQVFRSSMIMAHTQLDGQVNATDMVTRLLHGIVHTGLAPVSFGYGEEDQQHFDGNPVDFVADSVAAISCQSNEGYQTFHVVNPHHDDGVGLNRIIDWVQSAGYPIERVADYGAWYRRFKQALEALDENERGRSAYPILYRWEAPSEARGGAQLGTSEFRAAVKAHTRYDDVPVLDEEYVHRYLASMADLGLVPEADPAARDARRAAATTASLHVH